MSKEDKEMSINVIEAKEWKGNRYVFVEDEQGITLFVDGVEEGFSCGGTWVLMAVNHQYDKLEIETFNKEIYNKLRQSYLKEATDVS